MSIPSCAKMLVDMGIESAVIPEPCTLDICWSSRRRAAELRTATRSSFGSSPSGDITLATTRTVTRYGHEFDGFLRILLGKLQCA